MCHIRFRKAWRVQGHSVDELPFRAWGGVWGSWLGFTLVCLVLIAQFYTAVCESPSVLSSCVALRTYASDRVGPIGGTSDDPGEAAETFFLSYLVSQISPIRTTRSRHCTAADGLG